METHRIEGRTAAGYERVEAAFRENFARRGEVGAALAVYHGGELVVDLWGGLADRETGRPWTPETLGIVFSATKGLAATCCLALVDRGKLAYDAPIADYWPGFGSGPRAAITVRQLMNHRSGLVAFDTPLTIADLEAWDPVVAAMQRQPPLWEPGTAQGYHGVTYGAYVAELFRRAEGRSIGHFLAEEIAEPLGADVYIGLPEALEPRVARLYPVTLRQRLLEVLPYVLLNDGVERRLLRAVLDKQSLSYRAFASPAELGARSIANFDTPRVRRLELPWANGMVTARGLARVYAVLAAGGKRDGVRIASPEAVAALRPRQSFERDRVLLKPIGWSQGFVKDETDLFSPNEAAFGHPGIGGALGYCDPDRNLAWAYVMNAMDFRMRSPRALALCHALYASLPAAHAG